MSIEKRLKKLEGELVYVEYNDVNEMNIAHLELMMNNMQPLSPRCMSLKQRVYLNKSKTETMQQDLDKLYQAFKLHKAKK